MTGFVALLRGINVGGRNMVKMDALKAIHESLGFKSVRTHLQSGNVVFQAKSADAARIERALEKTLGLELTVIVRTAAELREALKRNPLPQRLANPSAYVIAFLSAQPQHAEALDAYTGPEERHLLGRELYIYYGDGMARSKLTNALIERKLGVKATARNWNTVTKLLELCEALES
jgi:uncharacterized protein (DUF1697 family)